MGDLKRTASTDFRKVFRVEFVIIMVCYALSIRLDKRSRRMCRLWIYLSQVRNNVIPSPLLPTILLPIIESSLASRNPSEVIGAAASTQNLTTSIRFLNTLIVFTLDHRRLVSPIILTSPKVECFGGSGDVFNFLWVANTGFDD